MKIIVNLTTLVKTVVTVINEINHYELLIRTVKRLISSVKTMHEHHTDSHLNSKHLYSYSFHSSRHRSHHSSNRPIGQNHTRYSKSNHAHNKHVYNKYGDIKLFIYFAVRCGAGALSSAYSHAVHVHSHTTPHFPPRIFSSLSLAVRACASVSVHGVP